MKKVVLCMLLLVIAAPCFADILLPPEERAKEEARFIEQQQEYERKRARCPKNKPLYFDGKCYSCDDKGEFLLHGFEKCQELCPNRNFFVVNPAAGRFSARRCLPPCPRNKPLYFNGKCYSCTEDLELPMEGANALEKCTEICPNRKVLERPGLMTADIPKRCAIPKKAKKMCDTHRPIYSKITKKCYPCSWKEPIEFDEYDYTNSANCAAKCPNRGVAYSDKPGKVECVLLDK